MKESLVLLLGLLFGLEGLAGGESAELRLFLEVVVRVWLTSSSVDLCSRLNKATSPDICTVSTVRDITKRSRYNPDS